jgi:hypothetical protein
MVVAVPLDAEALDLLVRLGWAREGDDQRAIGAAIAAMLQDADRRYASTPGAPVRVYARRP